MPVITNIEDLRVLAQKRVPRMFYDYADSGSWTESTYKANESDFQKINYANVSQSIWKDEPPPRKWWAKQPQCQSPSPPLV